MKGGEVERKSAIDRVIGSRTMVMLAHDEPETLHTSESAESRLRWALADDYEVLAFGAKIKRAPGAEQVEQIVLTEPIVGNAAVVVPPVQHGGTRHLSAAQFIHDQRDSLALVASQDGRFTVFAWSPCEEMVHAHRVDVLLM